jgi:cobalt-zinc-cadmium efflux system protein
MESIAALLNSAGLLAVVCLILWRAATRLMEPPEVHGGIVLVTAMVGLGANAASAAFLMRGSRENLNMRAALLHVVGDALASVAALTAGALILLFGWNIADSLLSMAVALIIGFGAVRLLRHAVHVLLEGTPHGVDSKKLIEAMRQLPKVRDVHDLHIWTITSGYDAMSAHVHVDGDCGQTDARLLQQEIRRIANEEFGIVHVTVQIEVDDTDCTEAHVPDASQARRER